jgi:hypothetical protein
MKKMIALFTASIAALALTVACSTKKTVTDESMVTDPGVAQTTPDLSTPAPVTETPSAPAIPDETAKVASLGASSSGRSR